MKSYDITLVGGGIVGAAVAYKLQLKHPMLKILLLEKEDALAAHQTGNNSGVIHSGIYYKPGSLKAKHCIEGRHQLVAFAKAHDIAHDVCGKIIVAVTEDELRARDDLYNNGLKNGIEGIEKIDTDQIRDIEPFVQGLGGIWVPCTGIIDFRSTTEKLASLVASMQPQSKIVPGEKVISFSNENNITHIFTSKSKYRTRYVIFCGGLFADRLAKKDRLSLEEKVVGFRGDYYMLTGKAKAKVRNLIYPVPNPKFPFLGIHFTRMVNGDIECGPNAVLSFKREGYQKTDFNLQDTFEALSYSGTWNLFYSNFNFTVNEYRRAFSKRLYLKTLKRLIPSLTEQDITPGRSGVRAMLLGRDGRMIDDFKIICRDGHLHVLNAPSPAATACLSIADEILNISERHFDLTC
jgi:L-2-hydroxyglutarate oxidase